TREADPAELAVDVQRSTPTEDAGLVAPVRRNPPQAMPLDDFERLLIRHHDRAVDGREVDLPVVRETVVHTLATDVDASFGIVQRNCIAPLESCREGLAVDE